jgi:DnaJ-domain-containing protein 1
MSYFHERIVKILADKKPPTELADEIIEMLEGEGVLESEDDEEEETQDEVIVSYFKQMNKNNGWSMAYTLTEEFFGISEDELTEILEEFEVEDDS